MQKFLCIILGIRSWFVVREGQQVDSEVICTIEECRITGKRRAWLDDCRGSKIKIQSELIPSGFFDKVVM